MKLHVIGTGSKGNCYILEGETSALIIECGMPFYEVKKALDFKVDKIVGCIVSHEHGDHCSGFKSFLFAGINIYLSYETFEKIGNNSYHFKPRENRKVFYIGEFKILPFDVDHDVPTFGFLINHPECGNVLFITDTVYCKYVFTEELNQVIIEANYSDEIINNKSGGIKFVRDRVINSHMELGQCIRTLRANNLTKVNNIVLIHLSDSNSDEKEFKRRVEEETGKNVTVASNGMKINFNINPF